MNKDIIIILASVGLGLYIMIWAHVAVKIAYKIVEGIEKD